MPAPESVPRPSLRWRIGGFTALALGTALAALTAAAILEERRAVLAVETETARSLLGHLATMPELRSSRAAAEARLEPLRDALAAAGVSIEIGPRGASPGDGALASEPIALSEGPFRLVYRMDPARLARIARRSAAVHVGLGALALGGLLLGTERILRRRLVATVDAFALQVHHMGRGIGWQPRLPRADRELSGLAASLADLGPALEAQVHGWIAAERRVAEAQMLGRLRKQLAAAQERALLLLGDLQARNLVLPPGVAAIRTAISEVERVGAALDTEERERFGPVPAASKDRSPGAPHSRTDALADD